MATKVRIDIPSEPIAEFCRRWGVERLELFGSAVRDDFREDSDVDVLATFREDARVTLFSLAAMEEELAEIFGRHVDLVDRRSFDQTSNHIKKRAISRDLQSIYGA